MNHSGRCTVVLAAAVIFFAGVASAGAETLYVHEFAGTFEQIDVPGDGSTFELLGGEITVTAPDTLPEPLTIDKVIVDLTGYNDLDGGNVSIVGDSLIIRNAASATSATLAVDSATLTQVLNSPIGAGYVSLGLSLSGSNLMTDAGSKTIHLEVSESVVTINGLVVTTDGSNGTASPGTLSSASISALIPEPSSWVLALLAVAGCGGHCWRRRRR